MRTQLLMPIAEWACYLHELPALAAERSLQRAEAAALPWMASHDRRRALARLRALALGYLTDTPPGAPTGVPTGVIDGLALRHTPSNASLKDLPAHPDRVLSPSKEPACPACGERSRTEQSRRVEGRAGLPSALSKGLL